MGRPRVGSVYRHEDHWDIRLTLPDGTRGNPKCQAPEMSEQEARAKAKRLSEQAAREGWVRADAPQKGPVKTIGDLVERWEPLIDGSDLAPATRRAHVAHAKGPISDRFGKSPIHLVTSGALRAWVRDMKKTLSASRTRNIFFSLARMLDDAAAENWIDLPNPCRIPKVRDELPPLRAPDDDDKAHHTEAEASKLIRATKAPERRLRYLLAFTSGVRDGELAGLRWRDREKRGAVEVLQIRGAIALWGDDGHATRRTTKTSAGKRALPLHPIALVELEQWQKTGWARFVGRKPTEEDPVLPNAAGAPFRPRSSEYFCSDLETAGLSRTFAGQPFEFRSTRRSFSTWLEAHGVPGEQIDRLLGHAGGSVRRRHYSAADVDALARAVATIQLELGGRTSSHRGGGGRGASRRGVASEVSSPAPATGRADRSKMPAEEAGFEPAVPFGTAVFKKAELGERRGVGNAGDDAGFGPFDASGWQRERMLFPPCYHERGFIPPRLALAVREGGGRRALR
jgi:integrase